MLLLPLIPASSAQGDPPVPSTTAQQQAADKLLEQLNNIDGAVDPSQITIDPALGPPPWISFVPGRDESTIEAWAEFASRLVDPKVAGAGVGPQARALLPTSVDIEGVNETGLNDTIGTGQFVGGFGTGPGESDIARIAGALGSPLPPPPEPDCPSVEEDGSIPDANDTLVAFPDVQVVLCGGVIGDGEFGDSTGDVDFFSLNGAPAGSLLSVDAGSFDPTAEFAVTTAIYTADGTLLGALTDTDSGPESVLSVIAPADGLYYVAVAGADGLLADPFDPSSGPGTSYLGDYLIFTGVLPPPPAPCLSIEPDSSITEANVLPFGPGEVQPCFGLIGDGDFGDSTGDFDFFALTVEADSAVIVDIFAPPGLPSTPTTIGLYNSDGVLLAERSDDGVDPGDFLQYPVESAGTYYALVSSPGVLPSDPFDPSSGTVAGPPVSYEVFVLSIRPELGPVPVQPTPTPIPAPPGDPVPAPPGDPIPTPTAVPAPPGEPIPVPPDGPAPPGDPIPVPPDGPAPPGEPIPVPPDGPGFAGIPSEEIVETIRTSRADWNAQVQSLVPAAFNELDGPCESIEDDGSISVAQEVNVAADSSVECFGEIGDGPFGKTSGDFDMYAVFVAAGEALVVATSSPPGTLDSYLTVYDVNGTIVAANDDLDGQNASLEFEAPVDDVYYVEVSSYNSTLLDPFDSSSGSGANTLGPYVMLLERTQPTISDVDVFLVDLDVGDALSVGLQLQGGVAIVKPNGALAQQSFGSPAFIYPIGSPLRHLGNVGADYIVESAGIHAIVIGAGTGRYEGELRVRQAGLADQPGDDAQILFLDFDGGQFNQAIFDPFLPDNAGPVRTLSPMASFLDRWDLEPGDESAVIDAVIASVHENLLHDLQQVGGNGNRDATGHGGELDIQILNSRDHADPWGQPNVSRIIIGGTVEEAGILTIGIAQSIDPGNFDTTETAIVLLDFLSDPAGLGTPSLNNFGWVPPFTKIDLIGQGVGVIAAHEAGHFIGNWHTASFNGVPSVMDEGGDLATTVGVGPDQILGTADDFDTDFVTDEYSFFEGFFGDENTTVRSAQALSTGQANVPIEVDDPPAPGIYNLQNVGNSRVLDADSNGAVDSSVTPRSDDRWELIPLFGDVYNLRNVDYGTYLDGDANGTVDQSVSPSSDDQWRLESAGNESFYLFNVDRGRYLSATGGAEGYDVNLSSTKTDAERWVFNLLDDEPNDPGAYIGYEIALNSVSTGRWLDTDGDTNVDQSVYRGDDDVWSVRAADNGNVYLVNAVTNRYLDADSDINIDTSSSPNRDDEWQLTVNDDGSITLRNIVYRGYLHAEGEAEGFNVTRRPTTSDATSWSVRVITSPNA